MAEKKDTKKATTKKAVSQSKSAPKNTTKKATSAVKKESVANTNKVKATSNQNSSSTNVNPTPRPSSRRWLWILIPVLLLIGAGAWFVSSYVKTDSEGEVYVSNTRRFDQGELEDLKTGEKDGLTYQEVVAKYGQPTKKTETTIGNVRTVVAVWTDQNENDDEDKAADTGVILYFQGTGDLNETRLTSKTGTYTTNDSKNSSKSGDSASSKSAKTSSNSSSSK